MKIKLVGAGLLALGLAAGCFAQAEVNEASMRPAALVMLTGKDVERSRKSELVQRVKNALGELAATAITETPSAGVNQPSVMPWRWVLLNESEWMTATRIYGVKTPLAFGDLQQRVTYLRGSRAAAMSSLELQRLLAHELGHLVCGCENQDRADSAAEAILKNTPLRARAKQTSPNL